MPGQPGVGLDLASNQRRESGKQLGDLGVIVALGVAAGFVLDGGHAQELFPALA